MIKGKGFKVTFVVMVLLTLMFAPLVEAYESGEREIISSAPYSAAQLKSNTEILIKKRPPQLSDDSINAIFKDVALKIKTFDGEKYDTFTANLILERGSLVAQDVWNFQFLFNLKGIRDNKTESWKLYIEFNTDGNKVQINEITADLALVPDKYVELGKDIVLKNLDENIQKRTPEIAGSKWIMDENGSIVLEFKGQDNSAITYVTLDLNEKGIKNVEKHYWGEIFNLSIIEAFDNPQSETGYDAYGNELAIFLNLRTDTIYGCANYKILANTTRSNDKILIDINGIYREGGYCLTAMGPARFSEKLGNLKGESDLVLRYEGEEDSYKLDISDEDIIITPLKTSFTHIGHPLSLLRIPGNMIWVWCEENNQNISVCQKLYSDLEKLGAEQFKLKTGTYAFESFKIPNLKYFKYTGDSSKLENLIERDSAYIERDNEKYASFSINTWRGEWFSSWNGMYRGRQVLTESNITNNTQNGNDKDVKTSGFDLILGMISLVLAVLKIKSGLLK